MQPRLTLPAPLRRGLYKPLKKETLIITTTTTRVRLYDIDTGAYDVSSDGNSVDIYGAAYFAGADQRYFMVPETGSVYTLTELEGLKAEGYGYDLAALYEVWPAVADSDDSYPSDWTEDPPADGSIAPPRR